MAARMKEIAVAVLLAAVFVHGRANSVRMPLGDKELLESAMNGALYSHGGRALLEDNSLKSAAGSILSDVAGAATTSPATVFSSFLKSLVSEAQDFSSFNKSQLSNLKLGPFGALNVNDPVLTALSQLSKDKPDSILSAEQTITDLLEEFCDPATCSSSSDPSDPTSSSCTAKSATLALEPWSCVLNSNETALECTPAVLVLQKTPASCSLQASNLIAAKLDKFGTDKQSEFSTIKSFVGGDAVTYTGPTCQYTKVFGQAKTDIYGADPFSLNLGALLGKGISPGGGSGSASVQLAGNVVGNVTASGGR